MIWTAAGDQIRRSYQMNLDVVYFQQGSAREKPNWDSSRNEPSPKIGQPEAKYESNPFSPPSKRKQAASRAQTNPFPRPCGSVQ